MLDEKTPPTRWGGRRGGRLDRGAGLEFIADRRPNPVPLLRIDDLPIAHPREVAVALRRAFAGQRPFLDIERVAVRVLRSRGRDDGVAFDDGVVRAIDLHV